MKPTREMIDYFGLEMAEEISESCNEEDELFIKQVMIILGDIEKLEDKVKRKRLVRKLAKALVGATFAGATIGVIAFLRYVSVRYHC